MSSVFSEDGAWPRRARTSDVPRLIDLAVRRFPPFEPEAAAVWLEAALKAPAVGVFCTDHAAAVAQLCRLPWAPSKLLCVSVFLVADEGYHWEAMRLVKEVARWGRASGAAEVRFGDSTGTDLGPLVKRIGAVPAGANYVLSFEEEPSHG